MDQSEQALTKVRDFIASRHFADDGRIPPERTLAMELGLGRRTLRRALDVLEKEGRILRHQGRGTFVNRSPASLVESETPTPLPASVVLSRVLDETNPLEVIEMRLSIEPVMARLAALRASQAEIARLTSLAAETREARDAETYEQADVQFHRTIAEAARNSLFIAFFDTLRAAQRDSGWRRLGENANCYKRQGVYATFHDSIVAAIKARNGAEAYSQMQLHLIEVQKHIQGQAFPVTTPS